MRENPSSLLQVIKNEPKHCQHTLQNQFDNQLGGLQAVKVPGLLLSNALHSLCASALASCVLDPTPVTSLVVRVEGTPYPTLGAPRTH